jgi:hypothetical protein
MIGDPTYCLIHLFQASFFSAEQRRKRDILPLAQAYVWQSGKVHSGLPATHDTLIVSPKSKNVSNQIVQYGQQNLKSA